MLRMIKTLIKKTEDDSKKSKDIIPHALELKELILLNGHTTQSNLQIKGNPYQNNHAIFQRTRINNPDVHIEPQMAPKLPK